MTKRILVAIDLEDAALTDKMLRTAGEIAGLHDAHVSLLHVAAELPANVEMHLPEDFQHQMSEDLANKLKKMTVATHLPPKSTRVAVRHGQIHREILAQAEADDTELIIMGCHKPEASDFLLGSNTARVCRHAACSVYVIR